MILLELASEGFLLAVTLVIPLAVAAVVGGAIGGFLVSLLGLQEQSIATIVRAAAVIGALVLVAGTMRAKIERFCEEHWSSLSVVGRGGVEPR